MKRFESLRREVGHWIGLTAAALWLLAGGIAAGQQTGEEPPAPPAPAPGTMTGSYLVVESDPSGAMVLLRGPFDWVGQTPWHLDREVSGIYRVEARLPGYETWRNEVVLGGSGIQRMKIELSRKTRLKAFSRSLLDPGWGQLYRGSKTKGVIFMSAMGVALGGLVWTGIDYQNRLNDFHDAQNAFERARRLGPEWDRLYQSVRDASDSADRAFNRRQVFLGAALGIYALSALDALAFSADAGGGGMLSSDADPSGPQRLVSQGLDWDAWVGPDAVGAGLRYRWN